VTDHPARRRGAKRWMDSVTIVCVSVAIAIGTSQLVNEGLQEFLTRPAGVGATPSEGETGANPDATTPPPVVQNAPAQPSPSPPTYRHRNTHNHG